MSTLENKLGKIITIDGGDRAGKHTQAVLLFERLKKEGYKTELLDFPQYNTLTGKLVKEYLSGLYGSKEQLGAKLPSLLYAANRFEEKHKLLDWLANGSIIILDRYTESNMAFQSAKLSQNEHTAFLQWLEKLEYDILGLPKSDIVLYLHVPHQYAEELAQKEQLESGKSKDIHELDGEFQKKVIAAYLELSKEKKWNVIECVENNSLLPPERIAEKIWIIISPYIKT